MKGNMRERHSVAWEEIQPPIQQHKKRKPRRVDPSEAKEKFQSIHNAVDLKQHLEALSR